MYKLNQYQQGEGSVVTTGAWVFHGFSLLQRQVVFFSKASLIDMICVCTSQKATLVSNKAPSWLPINHSAAGRVPASVHAGVCFVLTQLDLDSDRTDSNWGNSQKTFWSRAIFLTVLKSMEASAIFTSYAHSASSNSAPIRVRIVQCMPVMPLLHCTVGRHNITVRSCCPLHRFSTNVPLDNHECKKVAQKLTSYVGPGRACITHRRRKLVLFQT